MSFFTRLRSWLLRRHETNHAELTAETIRDAWLAGLRIGTEVEVVRVDGRNSWTLLDNARITRDAGDYWAVKTANGLRLFRKDDGTNIAEVERDRIAPRGSR